MTLCGCVWPWQSSYHLISAERVTSIPIKDNTPLPQIQNFQASVSDLIKMTWRWTISDVSTTFAPIKQILTFYSRSWHTGNVGRRGEYLISFVFSTPLIKCKNNILQLLITGRQGQICIIYSDSTQNIAYILKYFRDSITLYNKTHPLLCANSLVTFGANSTIF